MHEEHACQDRCLSNESRRTRGCQRVKATRHSKEASMTWDLAAVALLLAFATFVARSIGRGRSGTAADDPQQHLNSSFLWCRKQSKGTLHMWAHVRLGLPWIYFVFEADGNTSWNPLLVGRLSRSRPRCKAAALSSAVATSGNSIASKTCSLERRAMPAARRAGGRVAGRAGRKVASSRAVARYRRAKSSFEPGGSLFKVSTLLHHR